MNYLALLGTKGGPAIRPGSTMPTAHLLHLEGCLIIIDCGLGVARGLIDQGVALKDIRHIFITHLHSDHYLELGPLLYTAWTAGLSNIVQVYGPVGLDAYWAGFLASIQADIDLRIAHEGRPDLRGLVRFHGIDTPDVVQLGDIQVSALRNIHPPLLDTFALSFKTARSHIVFSGDTAYFPDLAGFAQGADLLVHEAMLEAAIEPLLARVGNGDERLRAHFYAAHSTAAEAARIAVAANVKALALNHLIPSDDPDFGEAEWLAAIRPIWDGPFYLGHDGLRIAF